MQPCQTPLLRHQEQQQDQQQHHHQQHQNLQQQLLLNMQLRPAGVQPVQMLLSTQETQTQVQGSC
jgi:hypothetical protein